MSVRKNTIISIGTSAGVHLALFLMLLLVAAVWWAEVATQQGRSSMQLVAQMASAQPNAGESKPDLQVDFEAAAPEALPPEPEIAPSLDGPQRRPPVMIAALEQQLPPFTHRPAIDQRTSSSPSATRQTQQPRTKGITAKPLPKHVVEVELPQLLAMVTAPAALASNGMEVDELPREAPLNPAPKYPAASLSARHQGRVMLRVRTTAEGNVASVEVAETSGFSLLDEAARTAVLEWRFLPARRAGIPVAFEFQLPIRFRIRS